MQHAVKERRLGEEPRKSTGLSAPCRGGRRRCGRVPEQLDPAVRSRNRSMWKQLATDPSRWPTLGAVMNLEQRVVEEVLGEVAGVRCAIALTSSPWSIPADALVISGGSSGLGRLGTAVRNE